jgi:hypothetical protein
MVWVLDDPCPFRNLETEKILFEGFLLDCAVEFESRQAAHDVVNFNFFEGVIRRDHMQIDPGDIRPRRTWV